MNLRNDKRQKNQLALNLSFSPMGETQQAGKQAAESLQATHEPQSPANMHQVMERICERENLKAALRRVKANKGSAGIDGMTVARIGDYLKQHWPVIREQLLSGTYEPKPVRRVEIAKPDGNGMRKLGIPTVLDRFIQQAVMQILQEQWDPTFSDHSYGFRPGRSAHQAVARAQSYIAQGYGWVIDLDLEKFLDRAAYCTPAYEAWLKSSGCEPMSLRRKPFLRPHRTWMASISPRLTRCHTVCRETPSRRMAWYMVR